MGGEIIFNQTFVNMYVTEYISLASQDLLTEYLQCYTPGLHVYHSSDTILELVLNIPEDARNLPSGEKQSVWTDPCYIGKQNVLLQNCKILKIFSTFYVKYLDH